MFVIHLFLKFKLDWPLYYFLLNNTRVRPSYFRIIAISDSVAASAFGISHHLLSRLRGVTFGVLTLISCMLWWLCICTFGSCELSIVVACIQTCLPLYIWYFCCDVIIFISIVVIMSCSEFFLSHRSFVLDLDWIYIFGSNLHNSYRCNQYSSKA